MKTLSADEGMHFTMDFENLIAIVQVNQCCGHYTPRRTIDQNFPATVERDIFDLSSKILVCSSVTFHLILKRR